MARNWFKDGQIDTALLDELEAAVKAVTDKTGGIMDQVTGKNLVPAFQCGHSQLLYPPDYAKEWGRLYGIGLGPDVCSEALDSDYHTAPPVIDNNIRRITDVMHGLVVTKAQMDFVMVTPEALAAAPTVLALGDEHYEERAPILLQKQLAKSQPLKALFAEWERRNGSVKNLSLARR